MICGKGVHRQPGILFTHGRMPMIRITTLRSMKGPLLQMVQPILQIIAASKAMIPHLLRSQDHCFTLNAWNVQTFHTLVTGDPHERVPHEVLWTSVNQQLPTSISWDCFSTRYTYGLVM